MLAQFTGHLFLIDNDSDFPIFLQHFERGSNRFDSLVVERPLRVRKVAGSNPGRVIPKT